MKINKTKTQHNICWTPLCANKHDYCFSLQLSKHPSSPLVFWWVPCSSSFIFFCVVLHFLCIMCLYVLSSVLWFPHKTIFGSSLPPVFCRRVHVLFTLFVFLTPQWLVIHVNLMTGIKIKNTCGIVKDKCRFYCQFFCVCNMNNCIIGN
jgi:hypothetical protein